MDLLALRARRPCLGQEEKWKCLSGVYFEKGKELLWLRSTSLSEERVFTADSFNPGADASPLTAAFHTD